MQSLGGLISLHRALRNQTYRDLYDGQNLDPRSGLAREGIERHFASMEDRDVWCLDTYALSVLFWFHDFVVVELMLCSFVAKLLDVYPIPEDADVRIGAFAQKLIRKRARQAADWTCLGAHYWFGNRDEALVGLAGYIVHEGFRMEDEALQRAVEENGVSQNDARYVLAYEAATEMASGVLLPALSGPPSTSPEWRLALGDAATTYRNPLMEFDLRTCRRRAGRLVREWYGGLERPFDLSGPLAEEQILRSGRCTLEELPDFVQELVERWDRQDLAQAIKSARLPRAQERARDDVVAAVAGGDALDRASVAARLGVTPEAAKKLLQRMQPAIIAELDAIRRAP